MKTGLKWLWWVLAATGTVILFVLAKIFLGRKASPVILIPPSPKETAAVEKQTEALIERAKAEAVGEERRERLEKIQKISDPHERRRRLAEELKDL